MSNCLEDPVMARALGEAAFKKYLLNNSKSAYAVNLIKVIEDIMQPKGESKV